MVSHFTSINITRPSSVLAGTLLYIIYIRVIINGLMFIAMAAALAYLIMRVAKTAEVRLLLETEVWQ